ncbi:hypothetical protein Scep_010822 [Stephania cephalantha]|uniref:Uncharacterized protein n=1 Tax=Stephania cephalantha TaxID=152367 RepID=A0AAP0JVT6_9MAGN
MKRMSLRTSIMVLSKKKESRTIHGTSECGEPKSMNLAFVIDSRVTGVS